MNITEVSKIDTKLILKPNYVT